MGICCVVVRLQDETIDELLTTPRKLWHFFSPDDTPEPESVSAIGRLLGFKAKSYPECSAPRTEDDSVDLDKSWDGIDFLLSNGKKDNGPCRLLTMEGERINEEVGYSRPYAFRSPRVREFHDFLATTSAEMLRERYDGIAMARAKVYPPALWAEKSEGDFKYVANNYERLKAFISETLQLGQGVIVFLT